VAHRPQKISVDFVGTLALVYGYGYGSGAVVTV